MKGPTRILSKGERLMPVLAEEHPVNKVIEHMEACAKADNIDTEMMPVLGLVGGRNLAQTTVDLAMTALFAHEPEGVPKQNREREMEAVRQLQENGDITHMLGSLVVQNFWHHMRWRSAGKTIYDLDERLARAFLATDAKLRGPDVDVPLPAFYIGLPRSLGMTVHNKASGEHPLDGMYVTYTDESAYVTQRGIEDTDWEERATKARTQLDKLKGLNGVHEDGAVSGTMGATNGKSVIVERYGQKVYMPEGTERALHIFVVGMPREGMPYGDDALSYFAIPLGDIGDMDLDSWIHTRKSMKHMGPNRERISGWLRIVLNTLLYITSDDADVMKDFLVPEWVKLRLPKIEQHSKKQAKKFAEANALKVKYSVIGRKIGAELDPNITRATTSEERKLTKRCIVRGHFKMQVHGEKRALRKRVWIKPYWKGESWEEVVARVQKVTQ
jgi:hypothetical protein